MGFFKSALPLLASEGSIIVTIFEGEPYGLWNIRDLARHVGLTVGRSFKFQASAYPGYKHARTLGNIEGGGGWKGKTGLRGPISSRSTRKKHKQHQKARSKPMRVIQMTTNVSTPLTRVDAGYTTTPTPSL